MLSSGDGCSLVELNEDQCWLYKEEEEGIKFSSYISFSSRREGRMKGDITAGSLRSEEEGLETRLHTGKREETACFGHAWI